MPERASADDPYRLGVLQIETDDMTDDTFAPAFMEELQSVLAERADITPVDTHVSLTQLSLGQDCNTAESACLLSIAKHLQVDGFLFGKLAREGGSPVAMIRRYDTEAASVKSSALVTFSGSTSKVAMHSEVAKLVNTLLGPPRAVRPAVAAADTQDVEIPTENAEAATPGPGFAWRTFGGYSLLGVAAVSVGLAVLSFVQIDSAEHDSNFSAYRVAVGAANTNVKDVCDEASAGKHYNLNNDVFQGAKDACGRGATFEVLQYVFIGTAVVAGGLATFLLLGGDDHDDNATATASGFKHIRLQPNVGRNTVSLTARMRF